MSKSKDQPKSINRPEPEDPAKTVIPLRDADPRASVALSAAGDAVYMEIRKTAQEAAERFSQLS